MACVRHIGIWLYFCLVFTFDGREKECDDPRSFDSPNFIVDFRFHMGRRMATEPIGLAHGNWRYCTVRRACRPMAYRVCHVNRSEHDRLAQCYSKLPERAQPSGATYSAVIRQCRHLLVSLRSNRGSLSRESPPTREEASNDRSPRANETGTAPRPAVVALLLFLTPLSNPLGEAAYRWVARNRHRFGDQTCALPAPPKG